MSPLLWRAGLRYHARHRLQLALALVGIALGVAVVVAVDLASHSARRAFTLAMEQVAGRTTHRLVAGPQGLDERLYAELRRAGVRPMAPVVEGYLTVGDRTLQLLGVDPFAEAPFREQLSAGRTRGELADLLTVPGAVAVAADLAVALGVAPGDRFAAAVGGRAVELTLAGVTEPADALARRAVAGLVLADIATAQELLGLESRLTRVDLILEGAAATALVERLPPGTRLERVDQQAETRSQMVRAFTVNLTALSLLALLVGSFLIYNTMSFSVVQRRPLLGTLRALGAGRSELFLLIAAEASALGLIGTLLGLAAGIALSQGLVQLVTRTINDLYFVLNVSGLFLSPVALAKGGLLGLGATLAAALAPALAATRVPPRLVLTRSAAEGGSRRRAPRAALAGLLCAAAGGALLAWPAGGIGAGFVAIFALICGFALAVPWLLGRSVHGIARALPAGTSLPIRMAVRGTEGGLSRTGVAVAALSVAVSVSIGMGLMVGSFRDTVQHWLNASLRADIYLSPPAPVAADRSPPLAAGVVEAVRTTPGVSHLSSYRGVEVAGPAGPVQLQALDLAPESRAGYRFKAALPAVWAAFAGGAVLVSEPFAYRQAVQVGDRIPLATPDGPRDFPVAGVFYDYESDRGIVEMDRTVYERLFRDTAVTGLGIYLEPGADPEAVAAGLRRRLAPLQTLRVRSTGELRRLSLAIFDRTFTITEVLRTLAVVVAFTGIVSALTALLLERRRELAVLRAVGMTPAEVVRLITAQSGLLGLAAGLLAVPLGLLLAVVLIEVINRRAFGWSLFLQVEPWVLGQGVLLALAAALVAGIYPARRLGTVPPTLALREE